jgi:hypothetical protein
MLGSLFGGAYFLFSAYFGFTFAAAFHAQWLFTNWFSDASDLLVALTFFVASVGLWRRSSWARSVSAIAFFAALARAVSDASVYESLTASHAIIGIGSVSALVWILRSSRRKLELRHTV